MRAAQRSPYALRTRRWLTSTLARPAFRHETPNACASLAYIADSRLATDSPIHAAHLRGP